MKKIAIVSTHDTLCGNAAYTKALAENLSKYFEVQIIPLNMALLRSDDKNAGKYHIETLAAQLKEFDAVNIQFEAGLFGASPKTIARHFFPLAKACKHLVVTMHRFHGKVPYPNIRQLVKSLVTKKGFKTRKRAQIAYSNNKHVALYHKIAQFCKKRRFPILVHTPREAEALRLRCGHPIVHHHPLCFFDSSYYERLKTTYTRKDFCKQFNLDPDCCYLSMFGFISSYKGYETAIASLLHLPEKYHLLIFGSQHPMSVQLDLPIDLYLQILVNLITEKGLSHRVHFLGSLSDEDFIKALSACDLNILPYLEVNQGGSAIAALSLEAASRAIFSQNLAFLELSKYAPHAFKTFSIGNHLELARAVLNYNPEHYQAPLKQYHETYNVRTNAELYKTLLTGNSI
jgi:glycosyltransferase involved in cell wall biosynthesis